MVEIEETRINDKYKSTKKSKNGKKVQKNYIEDDIDIYNVKRKTRDFENGDPGPSNPNKRKGKAREDAMSIDDQVVRPTLPPISTLLNPGNTVVPQKKAAPKKKVVRKKQPLNTLAVNPPNVLQMLNQSSVGGVSLLQYLAKDRDAARQLSQDLAALHRKKELNDGRRVVINELRNSGLLDESELSSDYESDDGSFETVSEYSQDDESDDTDTVIDYPFDLDAMLKGKPVRALVTINDMVINATIDSGAGASVISQSLVNKLGLKKTRVNKKFVLTGFNNAVSESNQVIINAEVRIGGKLRKEHFCVDENLVDRDICLLGKTWLKKHNITVSAGQNSLIVPVGNSQGYLEVKCVMDDGDYYDDEDDDSSLQVYAVFLKKADDENGVRITELNGDEENLDVHAVENTQETGTRDLLENLKLYHEDIITIPSSDGQSREQGIGVKDIVPKVIQDVIDKNILVFYEHAGLGRVKGVMHEIITTTDEPIRTRPYRLTRDEEESLEEELNTLLELGIIEASNGKYTSPVFFVPKKDGKLRLVVNFQKLNAITVKDGYPLPHIDDILDSLGGSGCFTVLDAAFGFWQIPLHPNSVEKTGFCTKKGVYHFLTLPMGLANSPSVYQRTMNNILREYLGVFVYVFVDDYVVYSKDVETHAKHLQLVFDACMKANLKLKLAKCQFCKDKVVYLGHEISKNGLRPNDDNIKKILQMREPKNSDECRSFLGTVGYYRRFIENFAIKAGPITKLLKKNVKFQWGQEQQDSFNYLQSTLISPPVLSYPVKEYVKILTCDASTSGGLGCILSQSPTGSPEGEVVIAYGSKTLVGSEKNYTINHLEALAIIWAVNRYRHYLSSKEEFIIRTDHAALVYIFNNDKPSPKLQRWKACLMGYNYRIEYRPGKENPADSLSRLFN